MKYASCAVMPQVIPYPITDIEPLDRPACIALRCGHQKVIVIRHQTICVDMNPEPVSHFFKQFQKMSVICPIAIYPFPVMPARRDMIPAAGNIDS